jgi:hypothetical protein
MLHLVFAVFFCSSAIMVFFTTVLNIVKNLNGESPSSVLPIHQKQTLLRLPQDEPKNDQQTNKTTNRTLAWL